MNNLQSKNIQPNHCIHFIKLYNTFMNQKTIILSSVISFLLMASIYIAFTTPVYQASALIAPPQLGDVDILNKGRQGFSSISLHQFTKKEIFELFSQNLFSSSTKQLFFNQVFLPSIGESNKAAKPIDYWRARYNKTMSINNVRINNPTSAKYIITIQNKDPLIAKQWIEQYLDFSKSKTIEMLLSIKHNMDTEVISELEIKINQLTTRTRKIRYNRIAALKEALAIADRTNIKTFPFLDGTKPNLTVLNKPEMMYLKGSQEIESEIKTLTARLSDKPFTTLLTKLESDYEQYQQYNNDNNIKNVTLFKLDGNIEVPDTPMTPKKALIITLSLILGLLCGVFLAILNSVFNDYQAQQQYVENKEVFI